jgi:hypothetical protein
MSILSPSLIAARADACAWLRRQLQAMDRLHRECGNSSCSPLLVTAPGSGRAFVAQQNGRKAD